MKMCEIFGCWTAAATSLADDGGGNDDGIFILSVEK